MHLALRLKRHMIPIGRQGHHGLQREGVPYAAQTQARPPVRNHGSRGTTCRKRAATRMLDRSCKHHLQSASGYCTFTATTPSAGSALPPLRRQQLPLVHLQGGLGRSQATASSLHSSMTAASLRWVLTATIPSAGAGAPCHLCGASSFPFCTCRRRQSDGPRCSCRLEHS